jgi:YD repeat-containing protein
MTDTLNHTATCAYDADGNLVQSIDRDGQETDYTYDALGRQTAELWINSSGTASRTIATGYYSDGLVESVTDSGDANGQYVDYTYTYDAIGRLSTVASSGPTGTPTVVLAAGYDRDGNRTSLEATVNGTADFQNGYSYGRENGTGPIKSR